MASRLPQRTKHKSNKCDTKASVKISSPVENDGPQRLRDLLMMLNHPSPPPISELARLFHGHSGEAFTFIIEHFVGRKKAELVRAEIQRLNSMPRNKTKDVFTSETAVERLTKAQANLARTKAEVATKRKELEALLRRSSVPHLIEPVTEIRATACLLQTLLAKENIRVERIASIKALLIELRAKSKRRETTPQPSTAELLSQIESKIPYGDPQVIKQIPESLSGPITPPLLTASTLRSLQSMVEGASDRLMMLMKEALTPPPFDDLSDTLALVHMWHNKLNRELPADAGTDGKDVPKQTMNMTSGEQPIGTSLAAARQIFFSTSPLWGAKPITRGDLDSLAVKWKYEVQRAEKLLSLYRSILEAASRASSRIQRRGEPEGPLRTAAGLSREKGQKLLGYVDHLRRRMVNKQGVFDYEGDRHAAGETWSLRQNNLDLRTDTASHARLEELVVHSAKLREMLSSWRTLVEVPLIEDDGRLIEDQLLAQAAHEEKALVLLTRKNGKMGMTHALEKDIRRFLDEGEAIVSEKVTGR